METVKDKPFLKFYQECMKTGYMPHAGTLDDANGLCTAIGGVLVDLFEPTEADDKILKRENKSRAFWGYGIPEKDNDFYEMTTKFTPLRQTIVLFCAAINNEL